MAAGMAQLTAMKKVASTDVLKAVLKVSMSAYTSVELMAFLKAFELVVMREILKVALKAVSMAAW